MGEANGKYTYLDFKKISAMSVEEGKKIIFNNIPPEEQADV